MCVHGVWVCTLCVYVRGVCVGMYMVCGSVCRVCVCVRGVCVCVHMVCTFAGACASGGACVQTDTHAEALSLTLCQGKS